MKTAFRNLFAILCAFALFGAVICDDEDIPQAAYLANYANSTPQRTSVAPSGSNWFVTWSMADNKKGVSLVANDLKSVVGALEAPDTAQARAIAANTLLLGASNGITKFVITGEDPAPELVAKVNCGTAMDTDTDGNIACFDGTQLTYVPSDSTADTAAFPSSKFADGKEPQSQGSTPTLRLSTFNGTPNMVLAWSDNTGLSVVAQKTGTGDDANTSFSVKAGDLTNVKTIRITVVTGHIFVYGLLEDGNIYFFEVTVDGDLVADRHFKVETTGAVGTAFNDASNTLYAVTSENKLVYGVVGVATPEFKVVELQGNVSDKEFTLESVAVFSNNQIGALGYFKVPENESATEYFFLVMNSSCELTQNVEDTIFVTATQEDATVSALTMTLTVENDLLETGANLDAIANTAAASKYTLTLPTTVYNVINQVIPKNSTTTPAVVLKEEDQTSTIKASTYGLTSLDNCSTTVASLDAPFSYDANAFKLDETTAESSQTPTVTVTCFGMFAATSNYDVSYKFPYTILANLYPSKDVSISSLKISEENNVLIELAGSNTSTEVVVFEDGSLTDPSKVMQAPGSKLFYMPLRSSTAGKYGAVVTGNGVIEYAVPALSTTASTATVLSKVPCEVATSTSTGGIYCLDTSTGLLVNLGAATTEQPLPGATVPEFPTSADAIIASMTIDHSGNVIVAWSNEASVGMISLKSDLSAINFSFTFASSTTTTPDAEGTTTPTETNYWKTIQVTELADRDYLVSGITDKGNFYYFTVSSAGAPNKYFFMSSHTGYLNTFVSPATNMLYALKAGTVTRVDFADDSKIVNVDFSASSNTFSFIGGAAFSDGQLLFAATISTSTGSSADLLILTDSDAVLTQTSTTKSTNFVVGATQSETSETTSSTEIESTASAKEPVAKQGTAMNIDPTTTFEASPLPGTFYAVLNRLAPDATTNPVTIALSDEAGVAIESSLFGMASLNDCTVTIPGSPNWFALNGVTLTTTDEATTNSFSGDISVNCFNFFTSKVTGAQIYYLGPSADFFVTEASSALLGSSVSSLDLHAVEMTSNTDTVVSIIQTDLTTVNGSVSVPGKGRPFAPFVTQDNVTGVFVGGDGVLTKFVAGSDPSTVADLACTQLVVASSTLDVYCLVGAALAYVPAGSTTDTAEFVSITTPGLTADSVVGMTIYDTNVIVASFDDTNITVFSQSSDLSKTNFAATITANFGDSKPSTVNVDFANTITGGVRYIVSGLTTDNKNYYFFVSFTTADGVTTSQITVSHGDGFVSTIYSEKNSTLYAITAGSLTTVVFTDDTVRRSTPYTAGSGELELTSLAVYSQGKLLIRGTLKPTQDATDIAYFFLTAEPNGSLTQGAVAEGMSLVVESGTAATTIAPTNVNLTVGNTAPTVTTDKTAKTDSTTAATKATVTLPKKYDVLNQTVPETTNEKVTVTLYSNLAAQINSAKLLELASLDECSVEIANQPAWFSYSKDALTTTADATSSETFSGKVTATCYGLYTASGNLDVSLTLFQQQANLFVLTADEAPQSLKISSKNTYVVAAEATDDSVLSIYSDAGKTLAGSISVTGKNLPYVSFVSGGDTGVLVGGSDLIVRYLPDTTTTGDDAETEPTVWAKVACETMKIDSDNNLYCLSNDNTQLTYLPSNTASTTTNFEGIRAQNVGDNVSLIADIAVTSDHAAFAWISSQNKFGFATFETGLGDADTQVYEYYTVAGLADTDSFTSITLNSAQNGSWLASGVTKEGHFFFVLLNQDGSSFSKYLSTGTGFVKTMYNSIYNYLYVLGSAGSLTTVDLGAETMTISTVPYATGTNLTLAFTDFSLYSNGQVLITASLTQKDATKNGYVFLTADEKGQLKETGESDIVQAQATSTVDAKSATFTLTKVETTVTFATSNVNQGTTTVTPKTSTQNPLSSSFGILSVAGPASSTTTIEGKLDDGEVYHILPTEFGLASFDNCQVTVPGLPAWLTLNEFSLTAVSKKDEDPFKGTATVNCYDELLTASAPIEITFDRKGDSANSLFSMTIFFAFIAQLFFFF